MRNRIWYELGQVKHNLLYCGFLLSRQRRLINIFNIIILSFSSAGIMGWTFWKELPIVSCIIIAGISLMKLLSPHIVPSEKQTEKLDKVIDFYFDYFNKLEKLWLDFDNYRINEEQAQEQFYKLKDSEREFNKITNEIVKSIINKIQKKSAIETSTYLNRTFN
jgi:hypothetical protein